VPVFRTLLAGFCVMATQIIEDNPPPGDNYPGDNPLPKILAGDNAPTRGPDHNRPTTLGSDPNPNRPTGRGIICKLTLTSIPDPKSN